MLGFFATNRYIRVFSFPIVLLTWWKYVVPNAELLLVAFCRVAALASA
jgi:hypothetical protein